MGYFIFLLITFINFPIWAYEKCSNLHLRTTSVHGEEVRNTLCTLIHESFHTLENENIDIVAIEEDPILTSFSEGKITFLSFFRPLPLWGESKYYIAFSKDKFASGYFTQDMKKGVLAHELAHTLQWRFLKTDHARLLYATYANSSSERLKKFEHQADVIAIQMGVKNEVDYAEGLADYRECNHEVVDNVQKKQYLMETYNFRPELEEIRDSIQ